MLSLRLEGVRQIYGHYITCPKERKKEIIRKVKSGSSIGDMADISGISYSTIWNWIYRPDGTNKK